MTHRCPECGAECDCDVAVLQAFGEEVTYCAHECEPDPADFPEIEEE